MPVDPEPPPSPTLLVVDDDPRNRALLREWLADRYRIREAADGPAALSAASAEDVDLVLLDVMMPGMSGLEVCRALKAGRADPFLPVVLLTALDGQEDRNAGLEAGADDFLSKPVDRRELLLRVRSLLRIRAQERLILEQVERLRELSALKDDLVSMAVHDLRNPLTAILGLLEALRRNGGRAEAEDLDLMSECAGRMRVLLEDMLRIRLLEEGRLVPNRARLPARVLVDDALKGVLPGAAARGVTLNPGTPVEIHTVVDPVLVGRALENLLSNAIRHAPRDSTVDVEVACEHDRVSFSVSDRGPGVSATARPHLFEKFGTGDPGRGFGLGLYLVRLVANVHGGDVQALDREGGGTCFRMNLPMSGDA
ncbi:MAG: hybrid sensor histidine kinase/response regulator [Myxococcota bacterium]